MKTRATQVARAERFWSKVDKGQIGTGCWEWCGAIKSTGYGNLSFNGQTRTAHRVAYELLVGPIPNGLQLDHLCRNRACVNPAHLEPVTNAENTRRGDRGKQRAACIRGHVFVEGSFYVGHSAGKAKRVCKACRRLVDDRRRPRKAAMNWYRRSA